MSVLRKPLPARLRARLTTSGLLVLGALLATFAHAAPGVSRILDQSDEDRIVLVNVEIEPEPVEPPAPALAAVTVTVAPAPSAAAHALTSPGLPSVNAPISDLIRHAALRNGVEPRLLEALVHVESAFNPRAVSPKGAQGLTQLMPQTARALGVQNAFDPRDNLDGGARHLRSLLDRFEQRIDLALAAYNAGEEAVRRHGNTVPPFQETRRYVPRIIALYLGSGARPSAQGPQPGAQRLQGL